MKRISFGTSGWRGILCEEFTFDNVKTVTQAIADNIRANGEEGKGVIVGTDTRFMGERFTREAASVLAGSGIKALLCNRDVPTPVIAFEIIRRGLAGGINFTASHNPPEYNGIKFSPSSGGPALPETTTDIENRANAILGMAGYKSMDLEDARANGLLEEIDPREGYLAALEEKVDFDAIATLGTIALNPLFGTARGYLDTPLRSRGMNLKVINDHRDPYFGGFPPEPAEKNIQDFVTLVKSDPAVKLGLATDGDADRFGILDCDGSYIEPNYIVALLLDYLIRFRKIEGGVARSVATSHLIDAVARKHGIPLYETPVGFKYIGDLITQNKLIIGGEESAGLTIKGHVPEKDGILACFLVAEMVAREGKSLKELLERLYAEVGRFITRRDNLRLSRELEAVYPSKVASIPSEVAGSKVTEVNRTDGVKLLLADGSWMLFRKSGTEPVVRLYGEASSEARLAEIMNAGRTFILG